MDDLKRFRIWLGLEFLVLTIFAFSAKPCLAHLGPPYPIMQDRQTHFGKLSVWTNPDVGNGTFIFLFDSPPEVLEKQNLKLELVVRDKLNTNETVYPATRDLDTEHRSQRYALAVAVPFSHEGEWPIIIRVVSINQDKEEFPINVTVTPPGPSPVEFMIFFFPFLALAVALALAIIRRRGHLKGKRVSALSTKAAGS